VALGKRSVSVEYDDETVSDDLSIVSLMSSKCRVSPVRLPIVSQQTATCMTVDRVHFSIHLWRGRKASHSIPVDGVEVLPDFAHAVICEVIRMRGSVMSFHRASRAILQAAMGYSSGEDKRKVYQTSVLEFPRFAARDEGGAKRKALAEPIPLSVVAMEHAVALLKKDRIRAQQLGMESLVNLTDISCCGPELAAYVSLAVVGSPVASGADGNNTLNDVHQIIFGLIRDRVLPGEVEVDVHASFHSSVAPNADDDETPVTSLLPRGEEHHGGFMRSMALRVLANALTTLKQTQPKLLGTVVVGSVLESRQVLQALAGDLLGATRPPAVVVGTRLASAHEAAMAMRILQITADNSPRTQLALVNPNNKEHPILDTLTRAKRVPHAALVQEAKDAYDVLSRNIRSC
jgi:hypothetical protein